MPLDYEQHLSGNLRKLYCETECYEPLRNIVREWCRDAGDGLVFAVRKNEIHIYYRGGKILEITEAKRASALKICTDPKYAGDKDDPNNEIKRLNNSPLPKTESAWRERLNKLKSYIAPYQQSKDERRLQHNLELNNRDFNDDVVIIDNEYGVRKYAALLTHLDKKGKNYGEFTDKELEILAGRGLTRKQVLDMTDDEREQLRLDYKLCKVDLVALVKDVDGKYKICLIELKKGNDAIDGKAGIKDHMRDFKIFINERKADIVKSTENLIKYKTSKEIDTVSNYRSDEVVIDKENIFVSIVCYNLKSDKRKSVKKAIDQSYSERYEIALPNFHYNLTKEEDSTYKLHREDLLENKF